MALTGKTIGQLTLLTGITQDTLFAVELSGLTYHIPYSSITTQDIFITGGTYSSGTLGLTNNTGGTISITGLTTPPNYYYIGDSSINTNINWANGVIQELNLDDDPTLTFSNGVLGTHQILLLKQTQLGIRNVVWSSDVLWDNNLLPQLVKVVGIGGIDSSFNTGDGFDNLVFNITQLSDNRIIVGGGFTAYKGNSLNNIAKLNLDGSVNNSFNIGTGFDSIVLSIAEQSDNKLLIGGVFLLYSGSSSNRIIRLNSDGSIDGSFIIGSGFNSGVQDIKIQPDDKILVGGDFTSYSGISSNYIIRLNDDGSVDGTFNIGTGFDDLVTTISIQSDDKILVGGGFTGYTGDSFSKIIRLNTDGSVDNTFTVGSGFDNTVETISIQSDGKILVGGGFTSYSGVSSNGIIRLNDDGSVDTTFNVGTGFDNSVREIITQSDGKILVGGDFTDYNGVLVNRIVRLDDDGSVDTTFNIGAGFNDPVTTISIQPDNKILVGGAFIQYDGDSSNFITRLFGDTPPPFYNKLTFDYNGVYYIGSY
jgi:uncharacterized delta-60 repeat protein